MGIRWDLAFVTTIHMPVVIFVRHALEWSRSSKGVQKPEWSVEFQNSQT
jgi:hypothetical protein